MSRPTNLIQYLTMRRGVATTKLVRRAFIALLAVVSPGVASAGPHQSWGYLIDRLVADGVSRERARAAFADRRVPPFTHLDFRLDPREPRSIYRGVLARNSIADARGCRGRYEPHFRSAEASFGVPASVLSAILHVETRCGRNTGKQLVLHRLARLAMASSPANLRRNIARHTRGLSGDRARRVEARVRERARQLDGMFYPEVVAVFRLAEQLRIDPLGIRGSGSGAFGLPQFLPSSFLRFAVDGDGDEQVSLYDPADAIASAANYLAAHGWRAELTRPAQRKVIWAYNHSDAYIDTVLSLAEDIERTHPSRLSVAARAGGKRKTDFGTAAR